MSAIFVATLGQRPEAITVALDRLSLDYTFDAAAILHTDPQQSGITASIQALRGVITPDYPRLTVHWHELRQRSGEPLLDITDQIRAWDYYHGVLATLLQYKRQHYHIHLMIAGGRKAMSVYAALAAAAVFSGDDHLWTVLSPGEMLETPGTFHIPPHMLDQVQVINLPLLPTRLMLDDVGDAANLEGMFQQRQDRLAHFLSLLSAAEQEIARTLQHHPYATDVELGTLHHKSERTVENQLRRIYVVMESFFDFGEPLPPKRKRQTLIDILLGRR